MTGQNLAVDAGLVMHEQRTSGANRRATYHYPELFVTTWRIGTPIDPGVGGDPSDRTVARMVALREGGDRAHDGDDSGVGAVWRLEWRTALPYTLTFDSRTTRVDRPHSLEADAFGELRGTGRWSLTSQGAEGRETLVRYDWNVGTDKAWMNALAPVARPLFEWNHDVLMAQGGRGLARHLGAELLDAQPSTTARRPRSPGRSRGRRPVGCRRPGSPERPARSPLTHAGDRPVDADDDRRPARAAAVVDCPQRPLLRQGCAAPPGPHRGQPGVAFVRGADKHPARPVGIPGQARRASPLRG